MFSKLYSKFSIASRIKTHFSSLNTPTRFEDVGIAVPPSAAGEVRALCPRCSASRKKSRDRCLSVNVCEGLWYCHHCGWRGRLWSPDYGLGPLPRRGPRATTTRAKPPPPDVARRRQQLRAVWDRARPITADDAAGRYLRRRGIWQTPMPKTLRFHATLPYYGNESRPPTRHPALIAAIQGPDNKVVSLHRIYLTPEGDKAAVASPKKFMRPLTTLMGAAVRLDAPGPELLISEGVETGLSVRGSTGMPTWCALSTAGMESLVIPDSVGLIVIAADHDPHGKGEQAAQTLAMRLLNHHHRVKILMPSSPGDWADVSDNLETI